MGGPVTALAMPFDGLWLPIQLLFYAAFIVIVVLLLWTSLLFVLAIRARRSAPRVDPDGASSFLWVFVVPALNEERTIADSVRRLFAVQAENAAIAVIDDGSTDGTARVLSALSDPRLEVLTRVPPEARTGKAAALNAAWRHLDAMLSSDRYASWPRDRVIVVVVDADGRLDPDAPGYAASHFADEAVGGLQVLVRIYNRSRVLTWLQDVEFSIYGLLYQAGRTGWGTAGMGGNGQFNRLASLDSVADAESGGPWRDRLTEDQDLGLRLIGAGWRCVSDSRTTVEQQGLPGLRRLLRQRTRWAQGNLQAMAHLGRTGTPRLPLVARLDLFLYLLQPALQALVGIAFAGSIVVAIFGIADFIDWGDWWQLGFFFLLGFGGVVLGCLTRGMQRGLGGALGSILVMPVYAAYSWMIWPVLFRALARQATRRRDWAKTSRERVEATSD